MDKVYNHKAVEKKIYKKWEDSGVFKANPRSKRPHYSILMPPPNLTGGLHLGHAMQHAIMDALARYKRMQDFDVLLLPGVDHAGIQFEATLNKMLSKEGLTKEKMGREEWLKRAWQFKEEVYKSVHNTWKVFGLSADWSREVFTLDPKIQASVVEEFKRFWDEDLIYKGAYIVQWCPKDQTAIEDLEMEYQEKKEELYFVKYEIVDLPGEFITVATARPETIFADVAIAVYPRHPKYSKYVGKKARNPFTKAEISIIQDERVEKGFGTGALKITPGHDLLDYEIGKDNNLPILHVVDKTGRMTTLAGDLEGQKVEEARVHAVEKLEKIGAIEKVEEYTHSVPVCERCKTTVEPLISEEWFVKMKPLAQKALQNIDKIRFAPENYKRIISAWLNEIHDWCVSRSLWWGHRIPVWYCQDSNPHHKVGKAEDMVVSLEKPSEKCKTCGGDNWVGEEQIFDTWFSSGMWPLTTLGWPDESLEFKTYYPWDFEITAPEIKYLWIARMIMLGVWFEGKVPFENMFFHGMMRDVKGQKFSKSLGNGIDPNELRDQWGTDAVRMALYSYSAPGRDALVSRQLMDERCKNFRNFITKINNIYRFIYELKPDGIVENKKFSHPDDKEIVEKLSLTIAKVSRGLNTYELHIATEELYEFIWHEFADIYLEKAKNRREDAQACLEYVFLESLKLLHPFMPFVTEEIFGKLSGNTRLLITEKWPHEV